MSKELGKSRQALLARILREHIVRHDAGETVDVDALVRDHPDLQPELEQRLRDWQRVESAKVKADETITVGTTPAAEAAARFRIPGYRIDGEIHRGGQGVVYAAFQQETKRKVAIKLLLEGSFASARSIRRFEREIELAAKLDHPNITSIYHSGRTREGLPFFAMDFVDGTALDEFVRSHTLTLDQTLQLFIAVCEAVEFAHQRGIIHRDLKPSNILVDQGGTPKILDFGLAKLEQPGDQPLVTAGQEIIGTLPYMAPEQARGDLDAVDIRTDVYALGVILYRLLSGHYPYRVDGSVAQALENIQHADPVSLVKKWTVESGVLSRSGRRLRRSSCPIDSEVDTIVAKALSKDKNRRYPSAGELARDLRRYRNHEPIEAKRDSGWYVLQKNVRRHKLPVAVAAAFLVVLVSSTVVSRRSLVRAEMRAAESDAVSEFMTDVFSSIDPDEARGREVTVNDLLEDAVAKLDTAFRGQPLAEAALRRILGNAYGRLGQPDVSVVHLREAIRLRTEVLGPAHPETLVTMQNLANTRLGQGRYAEARRLCEHILPLLQSALGDDHLWTRFTRNTLASALAHLGERSTATALRRSNIAHSTELHDAVTAAKEKATLSGELARLGRLREARSLAEEAVAVLKDHRPPNDPATLAAEMNLANIIVDSGEFEEAETRMRDLVPRTTKVYGAAHRRSLIVRHNLASVLSGMDKNEEAEQIYRSIFHAAQKTLGDSHTLTLSCRGGLASVLVRIGRYDDAETLLRTNLELIRGGAGDGAEQESTTLTHLVGILINQGKHREAEGVIRELIPLVESRLGPFHETTLRAKYYLAHVMRAMDKTAEADALIEQQIPEVKRAISGDVVTPGQLKVYANLVLLASAPTPVELETALKAAERAIDVTGGADPQSAWALARIYDRSGDTERAVEILTEALAHLPENATKTQFDMERGLGKWLAELRQFARAERHLENARTLHGRFHGKDPIEKQAIDEALRIVRQELNGGTP